MQNCVVGHPLCIGPGQQPARQRRIVASQIRPDIAPPHSESTVQPQNAGSVLVAPATHAMPSVLVAQPERSPIGPGVQITHRFVVALHAGVAPEHRVDIVAVHSTHSPVALHAGVAPEQSVSDRQPMHRFAGPQIMVIPVQRDSIALVHSTQRPALVPEPAHAGVVPVQSAAVATSQARQMRVTVSQIGVPPPQSALRVHIAQEFVGTLQLNGPAHTPGFVALHCTHRPATGPVSAHTGAAPVQSESLPHGRQR